jgi:hypothetical protein
MTVAFDALGSSKLRDASGSYPGNNLCFFLVSARATVLASS